MINNLASSISVTGWEDTIWLTKQLRVDKDWAVFGEFSFDFTDKLTGTIGARHFDSDNSLKGFFGFSEGYSGTTGEAACPDGPAGPDFMSAPCKNLDKSIQEDDITPRFNLAYQIDADKMVYATYSEGFRPGGVNRRGTLPPYLADWLTNIEFGWKTTWMNNRLRINGAVFNQTWDDFQFALLGAQGLTEINNAGAGRDRWHRDGRELGGHRPVQPLGRLRVPRWRTHGELLRLRQPGYGQSRDSQPVPVPDRGW
jgi:iron complex outermembrane recepter protein